MNRYDPQIASQLADLMRDFPTAKAGKMFGMPGYKVNGKLAVGMFESDVVAKLGQERAQQLIGTPDIDPLEIMPGRAWKDWIRITGSLAQHRDLLAEAVEYVTTHSE
jgi:hypothetical protein